jgi:outer membrane protein assembly factor BamB
MTASGSDAAAWPNWRGPTSSGGIDEPGITLVDDLNKATLVWKSEEKVPSSYGRFNKSGPVNGGFCDPVVGGGKVFLYYNLPSGPMAENYLDASQYKKYHDKHGIDVVKQVAMIAADDFFICLNAETGKLLWKQQFKEKGFNYCDLRCYPHSPQCIPAYADGMLYGQGSAGKVYCMDAKDGNLLWESDSGAKVKELEALKAKFAQEKKKPGPQGGGPWAAKQVGSLFDASVLVVDGVVVVCDWVRKQKGGGYGMSGLDGQTGKRLWNVPDCIRQYSSPCRWTYGGKGYAIGAGPKQAVCVEPKTGKIIWEITGDPVHAAGGTPAISGDIMVLCGHPGKMPKKKAAAMAEKDGYVGYRLSLDGVEKIWSYKVKDGGCKDNSPIIHRGYLYTKMNKGYSCINAETGEIAGVLEGVKGTGYAPIAANGRLLLANSPIGYANADPSDLRMLPSNKEMQPGTYLHPVVAGGRLYYRGTYHIYCWDLRKQ